MNDIARRIQVAEARLPPGPPTGADALRRRITTANNAGWFVGAFGSYSDYLEVSAFADQDDLAGALSVAERVNAQTDEAAIEAYKSLALELLSEKQIIRLQDLVNLPHPLSEPDINEWRDLIFLSIPHVWLRRLHNKERHQ